MRIQDDDDDDDDHFISFSIRANSHKTESKSSICKQV